MLIPNLKNVCSLIMLLSLSLLVGCFARNAPPVNYYSLLSVEQLDGFPPIAQEDDLRIGIGPITLVDSIRRSQVVTRTSQNVYSFDEYNKWAGSLEKDVALTLGEAIGYFTGAGGIDYFPWMSFFNPTHRVVIHIERLDGQLGKTAVLHAHWNVLSADGKSTLASQNFRQNEAVNGDGYGELIRAESALLAELALDISRLLIQKR